MKKFLPLIFVLFTSFVFSQTNRFFYELKSRNNATEDYKTNVMVLDINPTSVKFYDKDLLDYDSINKSKNGTSEYRTNTKTDQLVIRKPNSFKNNWYRDFKEYFVVHSNDEMTWKLNKDTLNYRGYILQKATTNFGGRVWTAWFSQEIPISEGPYKFQGLPGFIFLLNDSENNLFWQLKGRSRWMFFDSYENVKPIMDIIVEEGDMIFIPSNTIHYVESESPRAGVAILFNKEK